MQQAIEQELGSLGGHSACIVIQPGDAAPQERVSINPDMVFPAASLAKVAILVEVARQVDIGSLTWDTRYSIPDGACVGGNGILSDLTPGLRPTLYDIAHLMITISDNTAANVLLYLVGIDAVNITMQQLGLTSTKLERRFMDFEARRSGRDNWTSAGDMALLFSYLCTNLLPGKEKMLAMLLRQNDYTLLPAYWGEDVPFAHKTGGLEGIIHDAGILYLSEARQRPVIIVAMTAEQSDEPFTRYVLARIGKIVYETLRAERYRSST